MLVACARLGMAAKNSGWPALQKAPSLPTDITLLDEGVVGDYDLRSNCRAPVGRGQLVFVLNRQKTGENYYRLTLAGRRSELTRVQLGLEIPLAVGPGTSVRRVAPLLIRRRGSQFQVFANSRLLMTAYDGTYSEGVAGFSVAGGRGRVDRVQLQPVQPIIFQDDFMRVEDDDGDWQPVSGKWRVRSLDNPLRSANAFTYVGQARRGNAISVAGHWFWSDYRVQSAAMSDGSDGIGLITCYRDRGNYLLFEWTGGNGGGRRLTLFRSGRPQLLAQSAGGYLSGQWYDLSLSVRGERVEARIDGQVVGEAHIDALPGGMIGLFAAGQDEVYFDDVTCGSVHDIAIDFRTGLPPTSQFSALLSETYPGRWQEMGGKWQLVENKDGGGSCRVQTASAARALTGEPTWNDYQVSATIRRVRSGMAGLCLLYQNEGDHYLFRTSRNRPDACELVRVSDGQESVVATGIVPGASDKPRRFTASVDRNLLSASVDESRVLQYFDPAAGSGRAGLYAEDCDEALFEDFQVSFTSAEPQPVFTVHEVFEGEVSMTNWAAAQSDWETKKATVNGLQTDVNWHRAPFPGDVEIEAEFLPEQKTVTLFAGATDATMPSSGYALEVNRESMILYRQDREIQRSSWDAEDGPHLIRLRKSGETLIGVVDARAVLSFIDREPLRGDRVGWCVAAGSLDKERVQVYSDHVITDTFRRAVSDWRTAGGEWAVSKRWQCDPRWSFFSGDNFDGPAVLWNKHSFSGDITVEFAAGIKMQRDRGAYMDYGRDINISLCADGKSVDSGYTFVFAGWGNTRNAILRKGEVVAESKTPLLTEDIHRKWFLIRAEKKGERLRFFIDDALVCEYEDILPLLGDRLSLWTYRCGIMVSRFRVSAEDIGLKGSPNVSWPTVSQTFYGAGS